MGVRGSLKPKHLKKCIKLYWNFQRVGGLLEKVPSGVGGMDNFWNYSLPISSVSLLPSFKLIIMFQILKTSLLASIL